MLALELTTEDGHFFFASLLKLFLDHFSKLIGILKSKGWNNNLWPQIPRMDDNEPCTESADMESKVQRFKCIGRSSERNNN